MAIESACIPLPSEIIMPLAGWMLIKDQGLGVEYTAVAAVMGATGNTLGSVIAYWVGLKGGRRFLERYGRFVLISRHDIERADTWFFKYGQQVTLFSRILPVVRTFISLPAGIARMSLSKFILYTFIGSLVWSWALAFGGFMLGQHWERLRGVMRPFDIPILIVVAGLVVWFIVHKVRQQQTA
ncbi:MAG: DedA family protein [Chloroflexi bacterium]|nr:DedA family protein [Chloroflexota bacterium]